MIIGTPPPACRDSPKRGRKLRTKTDQASADRDADASGQYFAMPEARPLSIVVLPSLPTKAVDGWLGNVVFVLITSIWVWGVQGRVAQAWSAGQWWTVLWMSGLLVVLVTLSWKAKVSLFTYARLGASNWANWRATRARGGSAPIDEWTHAWMSLIGCGVLSLTPLTKVRRADVERRYGVKLPDVVIEPGLQAMAEDMNAVLGGETSWTAYRIRRARQVAALIGMMFAAPIVCGVIGAQVSGPTAQPNQLQVGLLWLAIGLFLGIPIAGGIYIGRRLGTVTVEHAGGHRKLVVSRRSRTLKIDPADVLIGCVHRHDRSFVITSAPSTINAIITPTATTPAMRVVLNDPRAFIAALTASGGQDRPARSTLPSHDRPQGSA